LQIAPGLLAWIDSTCDWELNRRRVFDHEQQPPEAAIGPSEETVSIDAGEVRAGFPRRAWVVRYGGDRQFIALDARSLVVECRLTGGSTGQFGSIAPVRRAEKPTLTRRTPAARISIRRMSPLGIPVERTRWWAMSALP